MFWLKHPRIQSSLGAAFLVIASAWKWFVHPSAGFPESVVDGACGFLYGVSIALLLLSLRRRRAA
jgi:hypothetical protein